MESDDEDDVNEADWSSMVAAEMLAALTDAEKKRQEIINGRSGLSYSVLELFLKSLIFLL